MDKFTFEDASLPVCSRPQETLTEEVFGVYRQLAKAQKAMATQQEQARQEAEAGQRKLRQRLANLGVEAFHLRRCVATLRAPLDTAGLGKELKRLELLVKRFDQTLHHNGVEVDALEGRALDEVAEVVEVAASVPADVQSACVHETIDPLVTVDGQVLRLAKVISAVPAGES